MTKLFKLEPVRKLTGCASSFGMKRSLQGRRSEERQGFQRHDVNGLYLVKVAIKGAGTAYASFAHRKDWAGWSGDLSPAAFRDGVERTLKQFPNVRRTVICVDGIENFYDESGDAEKKCPKF